MRCFQGRDDPKERSSLFFTKIQPVYIMIQKRLEAAMRKRGNGLRAALLAVAAAVAVLLVPRWALAVIVAVLAVILNLFVWR